MRRPALVLVVEDDPLTAIDLGSMISIWRHADVHFALTHAQADEQLREHSFDVVISDIRLDDGPTGVDVLMRSTAPVRIATSGFDDVEVRVTLFEAGIAFIEKPYFAHDLVALLDRLASAAGLEFAPYTLDDELDDIRRQRMIRALLATGNKSAASRVLGWDRRQIRYYLDKFGIDLPLPPRS